MLGAKDVRRSFGVLVIIIAAVAECQPDWGYYDWEDILTNPLLWWTVNERYTSCNYLTHRRQSPISIEANSVLVNHNLQPVVASNYFNEPIREATLSNTGRTVKIDLQNAVPPIPTLTGGPAGSDDVYQLQYIHYHWGRDDHTGSEHDIDGRIYSGEVHYIHYNTRYTSYDEAETKPEGLLVIASFITVDSNGDAYSSEYEPLFSSMPKVQNIDAKTSMPDFKFPYPLTRPTDPVNSAGDFCYYTYDGSLTTPPCSEIVTWIISSFVTVFTPAQMQELRSVYKDADGHTLGDNFRPVQDLHDRSVYTPHSCE